MRILAFTRPDFFAGEAEQLNALLAAGLWRLHLRKPGCSREEMDRLYSQVEPQWRHRVVRHRFDEGVSHSCHSLEELGEWKPRCQYVFLSPVFDSISKQGYRAAYAPEALRRAAATGLIDERVVALGGISPANVSQCRSWGFGGVAVLGWLWQDGRPAERLRELQAAISSLTD